MANFLAIAHLDVWPLSASLRARQAHFKDGEAVRTWPLRWLTDGAVRVDREWNKWVALRNTVNRITRLPLHREFELGAVEIEMLDAGGVKEWGKKQGDDAGDGWQVLHLPLVTNPLAILIAGVETAHVPIGALTWVNANVPNAAVNLGEQPRYHLVSYFRKLSTNFLPEPTDGDLDQNDTP